MSLQPTPQNMGRNLFPLVASKFIGNRFASPTTNDRFCGSTGSKRVVHRLPILGSAALAPRSKAASLPSFVGKASADFRASVED
jgi:hypothetical protein